MDMEDSRSVAGTWRQVVLAVGMVMAASAVPLPGAAAQGVATLAQVHDVDTRQAGAAGVVAPGAREARLLERLKAETEVSVTVGNITLKVPVPPGHVRVVPEMEALHASVQASIQEGRFLSLVAFMPQDLAARALAGHQPGLPRLFSMAVDRDAQGWDASAQDFAVLKEMLLSVREKEVKTLLEENRKQVNRLIQERTAQRGETIRNAIRQVEPKPVHLVGERMIAFSVVARTQGLDASRPDRVMTQATTLGLLWVNGKVLRLQSMAQGASALDWSRTSLQQ